jgi:hypothetical protein
MGQPSRSASGHAKPWSITDSEPSLLCRQAAEIYLTSNNGVSWYNKLYGSGGTHDHIAKKPR